MAGEYCAVCLLVVMLSAQAQPVSRWEPKNFTDAENNSWFGMSDYEGNVSSSDNLTDLSSSSFVGSVDENAGRNASAMSGGWIWKQIQWDWWVIVQLMAALLGIVGNLLVIIPLFQRRKNSRSTDLLIGALATADLSTSIFMIPLPSADRVPSTILGEIYCKFVFTSFFLWMSIGASIWTLTFIPVERYIAIAYPFRHKEFLSRRKILMIVGLTWFIGFNLNIIFVVAVVIDPASNACDVDYPWRHMRITIGVVNFAIEFLIPCLITLIMQALTARSLHRQSRIYLGADKQLSRSNPSLLHLVAKRRVLKMLFVVVLIFILSWGPTQVLYLAYNFRLVQDTYLYSPLYRVVNVLAFCNSCANPIIYTVRYPEFRKALKYIFVRSKGNTAPLFDDRASKSQPPPPSGSNVA